MEEERGEGERGEGGERREGRREGERKGESSDLTLRLCWTDLQRTVMARLPELICALLIISSISTTEPVEAGGRERGRERAVS